MSQHKFFLNTHEDKCRLKTAFDYIIPVESYFISRENHLNESPEEPVVQTERSVVEPVWSYDKFLP